MGVWTAVGYTAGKHIVTLYHDFVHYEIYLAITVAVLFVAYVGHKLRKRHAPSP